MSMKNQFLRSTHVVEEHQVNSEMGEPCHTNASAGLDEGKTGTNSSSPIFSALDHSGTAFNLEVDTIDETKHNLTSRSSTVTLSQHSTDGDPMDDHQQEDIANNLMISDNSSSRDMTQQARRPDVSLSFKVDNSPPTSSELWIAASQLRKLAKTMRQQSDQELPVKMRELRLEAASLQRDALALEREATEEGNRVGTDGRGIEQDSESRNA